MTTTEKTKKCSEFVFPTVFGRPANPGESDDDYIERIMHENNVSESACLRHGSME